MKNTTKYQNNRENDEITNKIKDVSKPIQPKKSLFSKIKSLFPFLSQNTSPSNLVGRIHTQIQQDAILTVEQLQKLKENLRSELEKEEDTALWSSVEAVINPLLREYDVIQKKIFQVVPYHEEKEANLIKSYNEWIEKAKLWVTVATRPNNKENIIKAVMAHTMQISDRIIDRDMQTLYEYTTHQLISLNKPHEELLLIKQHLEENLDTHLHALHNLKNSKPADLKLEHLQKWKSSIDDLRINHYEAALQIIDGIITTHTPIEKMMSEEEHLKDLYPIIDYLEKEIPVFCEEIKKVAWNDENLKKIFKDQYIYLEEQIYQLNQDLRLSQELTERVDELGQKLMESQEYFE